MRNTKDKVEYQKSTNNLLQGGQKIMWLPQGTNVDAAMFGRMVEDKSASYKLFWTYGIFEEIIHGNSEISFRRITSRMLSLAWYPVTEYHLHLGYSDKIEETIQKVRDYKTIKNTETPEKITDLIEQMDYPDLNTMLSKLSNMVPYRLLHAFYKLQLKPLKLNDSALHKKIEELSQADDQVFYRIYTKEKKIQVNLMWMRYITENQAILSDWIKYQLIDYLQKRNPNVPGIPFKLEPPLRRNLSKAKRFWKIAGGQFELCDIYTRDGFSIENQATYGSVSIDHFIPWSFVMHDELWNLIPVFKNINSSKNNSLPDLDKYLKTFCTLQYQAFDAVRRSGQLKEALIDYTHANVELQVGENGLYQKVDKVTFCNGMEATIKPLYQIALNQGYEKW